MKKTLLTLALMLTAMAAVAQSITSATIIYTFNGEQKRLVCPASGFDVLDLSGTVAENFKIDAITVQTNGTINDLKILAANYKSGDDPEKIDDIPLSQRGDTWYLMIGDDEGWIVQNNDHSTATRYFSFYFVANEDDDNPVVYNNGGSYYSIRYKTEGKGGGGGGGGQSGNISFYDTYTAALTLSMTGGKESNINYMYNGDGTRNISDQPGGVSSLQISNFTLRLKRSSADLEIASVSLQYKVYEEGSDGQWNRMEFTEQEDEGGDILAKKYVGTRATQDLTKGLKQGTTYVLEVMYQVVDKNGNYYFFKPSDGNDLYKFSVNSGGGGGGEGGETGGNITFYDKNTATLSLGMTGVWPSDITYTYAGDGSRDISDQPGGVSSLEISGFTLRLQRASADLEIESVSLQYKVYEEGSDGQWNTLNYDFQKDEGGNILAKKYTGTTSTQGLTKGLKEGPTYILEVKYQIIDKNGNYYFFPSGENDLYRFSVNGGGGGSGESVRGDLNGDGEVNMQDVMFLVNKIVNGKFPDE